MSLANVIGDGDYRLLVANSDKKLMIYRGMTTESQHVILDHPSAMCTYYMDTNTNELPAVAVATNSSIFIYRGLRPFFKFTLPALDLHPKEVEVWATLGQSQELDPAVISSAIEMLAELRDEMGVMISPRSQDLLSIESLEARAEYIQLAVKFELKHVTAITCMAVLHKSMEEETAVGCLVLGLEVAQLMILSPDAHTIISKIKLPSPPVFIACGGTFDVEYRIFVGCREGTVCIIKNGELLSQTIELETPPAGLVRLKSVVVCATMTKVLLVGCPLCSRR